MSVGQGAQEEKECGDRVRTYAQQAVGKKKITYSQMKVPMLNGRSGFNERQVVFYSIINWRRASEGGGGGRQA